MQDPSVLIMDCRIWPKSHNERWNRDCLQSRWGKRYHYAGGYLGNKAHQRNVANRPRRIGEKSFPNEIEIANPTAGIKGLVQYISEGHDLILLCACVDYHNCHLKEIVALLTVAMPEVEVVLQKPTPQYKSPKGKKVSVKPSETKSEVELATEPISSNVP